MGRPAWSYSSLTAYETCPHRYYLTKVAKTIKEPASEEMKDGLAVHKALELRVKDKTPLPEKYSQYESICSRIESTPGEVQTEKQLAINDKFEPTGWFDKDVWCRAVLDVNIVDGRSAAVLDYKTGKIKPNSHQLMLSAAFLFHVREQIEKVVTGFLWLAHGKVTKETYRKEELPSIWREFLPRVQRLENAYEKDRWEKKPSGLCKGWCPCSSCEFFEKGK